MHNNIGILFHWLFWLQVLNFHLEPLGALESSIKKPVTIIRVINQLFLWLIVHASIVFHWWRNYDGWWPSEILHYFATKINSKCDFWKLLISTAGTKFHQFKMQSELFLLSFLLGACASQQWGNKISKKSYNHNATSQIQRVQGEGTYNPKSAWMFVDSRRRVLPDIDGRNFRFTI